MVGHFVGPVAMKLEQRHDNIPVASLSPMEERDIGRIIWPDVEASLVFTALVSTTTFTAGNPAGWAFG